MFLIFWKSNPPFIDPPPFNFPTPASYYYGFQSSYDFLASLLFSDCFWTSIKTFCLCNLLQKIFLWKVTKFCLSTSTKLTWFSFFFWCGVGGWGMEILRSALPSLPSLLLTLLLTLLLLTLNFCENPGRKKTN